MYSKIPLPLPREKRKKKKILIFKTSNSRFCREINKPVLTCGLSQKEQHEIAQKHLVNKHEHKVKAKLTSGARVDQVIYSNLR